VSVFTSPAAPAEAAMNTVVASATNHLDVRLIGSPVFA
jgi:hypothetical protein